MKNLTFNSHKDHNPDCDILCHQIDIDTHVTYGFYIKTTKHAKKGSEFMEVYTGKNYNVGSAKKSHSRIYGTNNIPEKYLRLFIDLRNEYVLQYI